MLQVVCVTHFFKCLRWQKIVFICYKNIFFLKIKHERPRTKTTNSIWLLMSPIQEKKDKWVSGLEIPPSIKFLEAKHSSAEH